MASASATPISFSQGGWLMVDVGQGHTYVEYHALSDPGGALPAPLDVDAGAGGLGEGRDGQQHLGAGGALGIGQVAVLALDQVSPQGDHEQNADQPAAHRQWHGA